MLRQEFGMERREQELSKRRTGSRQGRIAVGRKKKTGKMVSKETPHI